MIKVKANQSNRTFTIRKYDNSKLVSKYRTLPMSNDEFENAKYYTSSDWQNFLNNEFYLALK